MSKEEFSAFIKSNIVPSRILIEADVFTNEAEYIEAMEKGAKTRDQLNVVNSYGTDTYQMAILIRDSNFPDLESYKKAESL